MNHPTSRICVCVCVRLGNMCPIADCLFLLSFFFSETEDVAVAAGGLQIRQVYTYMGRVRGRLLRRSINSSALLSSIKNENRVGCFCEWLARLCPFFPPSLSDTQRRASRDFHVFKFDSSFLTPGRDVCSVRDGRDCCEPAGSSTRRWVTPSWAPRRKRETEGSRSN
jgi:hypothetical protein